MTHDPEFFWADLAESIGEGNFQLGRGLDFQSDARGGRRTRKHAQSFLEGPTDLLIQFGPYVLAIRDHQLFVRGIHQTGDHLFDCDVEAYLRRVGIRKPHTETFWLPLESVCSIEFYMVAIGMIHDGVSILVVEVVSDSIGKGHRVSLILPATAVRKVDSLLVDFREACSRAGGLSGGPEGRDPLSLTGLTVEDCLLDARDMLTLANVNRDVIRSRVVREDVGVVEVMAWVSRLRRPPLFLNGADPDMEETAVRAYRELLGVPEPREPLNFDRTYDLLFARRVDEGYMAFWTQCWETPDYSDLPSGLRGEVPRAGFIADSHEFEEFMAIWMRWLGWEDAVVSPVGSDGGVDVSATGARGQAKYWDHPVGIEEVQRHNGVCEGIPKQGRVFLSKNGYTQQALSWGETHGLPLFEMKATEGSAEAVASTTAADTLLETGPGPPTDS